MNTFSLRLAENEADALERLATVNGQSKNACITSLIVDAYKKLDPGCQVIDGEIVTMIAPDLLPKEIIDNYELEHDGPADKETLLKAYRAYKYVMADNYFKGYLSDDRAKQLQEEYSLLVLKIGDIE